jgi:HAE1 family hydrophobic/amphiphilic exporter-1
VDLDRELAQRYGIPLQQPADVVELTYRGKRLPRYRTDDGEREMRLTLDESESESLSQLRMLPLWTADGEKVPLASLAEFRVKQGAERIQRDQRQTSVWVGARYDEGTREDYLPLVKDALAGITFPYGYEWTFSNVERRRQEQSREFITNLVLALLLIFAVMAGLFESARQALGLMVALPFALAGATWTLYFTNTDFDQPAAVGLLLLIGIVVNNGIVMLEHINFYRRQGMPRYEAMIRGGRERLRPILMTAITTLVGLVPIVVQKPALAGVYYYSMALVIMGGLLVSTFLTAVLLPTTASLSEDIFGWLGRMVGRTGRALGRAGGRMRAVAPRRPA